MLEERADKMQAKTEINPYVSGLASKLMKTAANAELSFDSHGWQVITEVLSYAASAEQRLGEQAERISFLEQLSVTDELTGIPNRRGLRRALGQTLAAAARHNEGGILAFIDLDHFKDINDIHGHLAGDSALRHVAKTLKRMIRPNDIAARLSGDEFAVVLVRCNGHQGLKRITKLQKALNASTINYCGVTIEIGCSVGVKEFTGATDPSELIEQADQAMYHNKLQRRQIKK